MELIIVVSLLALVGLIAVVNYMEMQTRSKVARARSEMRSVAMGLEAFRADHTRYPLATTIRASSRMDSSSEYFRVSSEVTTPIAYLDSLPPDVFQRSQTYKYIAPGQGYINDEPATLGMWAPRFFPLDTGAEDDVVYFSPKDAPVQWALWSVGPAGPMSTANDLRLHMPVPSRCWYDPSNGTVSKGLVIRLSTGQTSP